MNGIQYQPLIEISDVTIGYRNKKDSIIINQHLNLQIFPSEMICLLGPNGCGKSTLIRTIAGMQPVLQGNIFIEKTCISRLKPKDFAHKLSVVLTDNIDAIHLTVYDIVSLGRFPYTNWFGALTEEDKRIIDDSLLKVNLQEYKKKYLQELSDGEKQRVMIAKALAQNTPFILLDEPTAHLDLPNRIEIMQLLQELAHTTGKSILLSTHELDLALRFSDKVWLMQKNDAIVSGTAKELLQINAFEKAFKIPTTFLRVD
ncbi:MAG: ABC transporter ATP-binding protein [Bacteroidales bacterium]|nr:ABC transporter ATP-binding protein [Bacteroidales bacterium]